jgi:flagellar basal body-associated protein FliL
MTSAEQKKSSNKTMILVVAVIVVAAGGIGIYAMSNQNIVTSQDAKDLVSDIKTDVENIDPGYGQVTKQEGAYSP